MQKDVSARFTRTSIVNLYIVGFFMVAVWRSCV